MKSYIILAAFLSIAGCGRDAGRPDEPTASGGVAPARHSEPKSPARADRVHRVTGEVRKLNREQGEVTIFHDAIPGVMGRMEMPFTVRDKSELNDLQVGDEVDAKLRILADRSELFDVSVTRAAVAKAVDPPPNRALAIGQEVPDFAMTAQDGKTLRLADLRGDVVVITFIYTRCPLPEFCPLMNRKFKEAASRLSLSAGRKGGVRLLSVSFDPEHDTPEVLDHMARLQGAKPPLWTFAVASHDELRKVAEPLGLAYGPTGDQVAHNLVTVVIDGRGRLAGRFLGGKWTTDELLRDVRQTASR